MPTHTDGRRPLVAYVCVFPEHENIPSLFSATRLDIGVLVDTVRQLILWSWIAKRVTLDV